MMAARMLWKIDVKDKSRRKLIMVSMVTFYIGRGTRKWITTDDYSHGEDMVIHVVGE